MPFFLLASRFVADAQIKILVEKVTHVFSFSVFCFIVVYQGRFYLSNLYVLNNKHKMKVTKTVKLTHILRGMFCITLTMGL